MRNKNVPFYLVVLIKRSCSCRRNEKQDISSCSTCTGIWQIDLKDLVCYNTVQSNIVQVNMLEKYLILLVFPGRITEAWIKNYTTETQRSRHCVGFGKVKSKSDFWIRRGSLDRFSPFIPLCYEVIGYSRWEVNLLILFWIKFLHWCLKCFTDERLIYIYFRNYIFPKCLEDFHWLSELAPEYSKIPGLLLSPSYFTSMTMKMRTNRSNYGELLFNYMTETSTAGGNS